MNTKLRKELETQLGRKLDLRKYDDRAIADKYEFEFHLKQEQEAFMKFEQASEGEFDGFDFVRPFHKEYNKDNAIAILYANDCADVEYNGKMYHVGEDGLKTYVMVESPTKTVVFGRSAYLC